MIKGNFEIWVADDAEYPGDMVLEEGTCESLEDVQLAVMQMWAEFRDGEHRKAILIYDREKPLKGDL